MSVSISNSTVSSRDLLEASKDQEEKVEIPPMEKEESVMEKICQLSDGLSFMIGALF